MFWKKQKETARKDFDREQLEPVIRCSICTGEEVAGFRNRQNGHFTEDRLLRSQQDLADFMSEYGISDTPRRVY